jgi:hypothetical protein
MNEELANIAREAGAPEQVMNTLWFNVFCQKFAFLLFNLIEEDYTEE